MRRREAGAAGGERVRGWRALGGKAVRGGRRAMAGEAASGDDAGSSRAGCSCSSPLKMLVALPESSRRCGSGRGGDRENRVSAALRVKAQGREAGIGGAEGGEAEGIVVAVAGGGFGRRADEGAEGGVQRRARQAVLRRAFWADIGTFFSGGASGKSAPSSVKTILEGVGG